jgi:hypothetical protein
MELGQSQTIVVLMTPESTGLSQETFLREYGDAVAEGNAAVFVGAGMSRANGYVDWKGLLAEFADELGLDLEIETDLLRVAQYHLNENESNRNRLSQKIVDEFSDSKEPTAGHLTLAKLPIDRWWTTNYDDVVERAIKLVGKKPHVIAAAANATVWPKGTQALVNKMHGDLSDLDNIVITSDDYEDYVQRFPMFRERLLSDLTERTFVFLGYSFTDPHFEFILSELRRAHGKHAKTHYAIMRREALVDDEVKRKTSEYSARRQLLRIRDLKRYGIQVVLVDEHDEIPELLQRLRQRYLRRHVFVAGAIDPSDVGAERAASLSKALGSALMTEGYNLVSGLGLGVGGNVVFGALDSLYREGNTRIDRRLQLWPFPQDVPAAERAALFTTYRRDMLATVGFTLVIAGVKMQGEEVVRSAGIDEEVAISLEGRSFVIPIGMTGHIAEELWTDYDADLPSVYGVAPDAGAWATLNDRAADDAAIVMAIVKIMNSLRPQ